MTVGGLNGVGQVLAYTGLSFISGAYYIAFKRFAVVFDVIIGKVAGEGEFKKRLLGALLVLVGVAIVLVLG